MKKDYYMHQQFILNVDYENISLENYICTTSPSFLFVYKEQKNLFDFEIVKRCVSLSFLLTEIDTEEQWNQFLDEYKWIDRFIIVVDIYPTEGNNVTKKFFLSTLKAFIKRLLDHNKEVFLLYS